MRNGSAIKKKMGVWQCLERLAGEDNPRLVALIEIKDARHLLKMRAALQAQAALDILADAAEDLIEDAGRVVGVLGATGRRGRVPHGGRPGRPGDDRS